MRKTLNLQQMGAFHPFARSHRQILMGHCRIVSDRIETRPQRDSRKSIIEFLRTDDRTKLHIATFTFIHKCRVEKTKEASRGRLRRWAGSPSLARNRPRLRCPGPFVGPSLPVRRASSSQACVFKIWTRNVFSILSVFSIIIQIQYIGGSRRKKYGYDTICGNA